MKTRTVLGADDISSAPEEKKETRRGVAGLFFAYKTAGAAADRGDDLEKVTEIAQRTSDRTRTMGVGLSPTILPAAGEPTFTLEDGEMEIGVGIHGEPGIHTGPLESADEITDRFMEKLLAEIKPEAGDRVAVLVNGLGSTPLEELYLIYRRVHRILDERGVIISRNYIGEYATSLEMAGASLSILELDDELEELLDAPAESPFYQHGAIEEGDGVAVMTDDEDFEVADEVEIRTVENPSALLTVAKATAELMPRFADELRELDAALGDGDLGITVSLGAKAAGEALAKLPENAAPSEVFRTIGSAFAAANPSTFAALIGGGFLAAGNGFDDDGIVEATSLGTALRAMTDRIQERGGAKVGDKTVVDVLDAVATLLAEESAGVDAVIQKAKDVITVSAEKQSQKGRAAWVGERSAGLKDPGQVAFLRLFEAIAEVL